MDVASAFFNQDRSAAKVANAFAPRIPTTQAGKPLSHATAPTPTTAGSTITSNDFLTLLVTEMKNQDPTQPTDPNAYIQQLVGVNSLQQLIQINQDLTGSTTAGAAGAALPVTPNPSM